MKTFRVTVRLGGWSTSYEVASPNKLLAIWHVGKLEGLTSEQMAKNCRAVQV